MKKAYALGMVAALMLTGVGRSVYGSEIVIESFKYPGEMSFTRLDDGIDYVYRVEWAPSPSGPWRSFGGAGSWLDNIEAGQGGSVTSTVPMFYRVVAHMGDYMSIDLAEGSSAASYPVTYYRTLADVPGGANSDLYKTTSLLLRRIPKGVFMMGSPTNELARRAEDENRRQVTLTKDYYIGVFPVTQQQWEQVMGNWPSYFNNPDYRETRPVEQVSYYDIREFQDNTPISPNWPQSSNVHPDSFMGRLRARTGLATLDLPTEAQWERACRAGTTTALNTGNNLSVDDNNSEIPCPNMHEAGRYYHNSVPVGHEPERDANADQGTAKTGTYRPNKWGLYDMHGNVSEWCLDLYEVYHEPTIDPKGPEGDSETINRVLRGGHYSSSANYCRAASRLHGMFVAPTTRNDRIGFRLAVTSP